MARTISRKMSYADQMANAESNVEKLPKWAQEYVAALQRKVASAERELDQIKNPPGDSNVFVVHGLRGDDQKLGKNIHIRFEIAGRYSRSIDIRHGDGGVYVMGDERIVIEPTSSNAIRIKLMER